ncbi:MAG TPA: extracellular solute-binding protein [Candidatus Binatia bacterium]|nr:extracellular solute-binding protein [Candidatus Binatia bacterium]
MKILFAALLALAFAGTASAQSKTPTSTPELAKYNRPDREKLLYEGAKKEGKVVWYTSLVPSKEIAKIFESKYPGVSVEVYRAGGIELLNKALSEYKARRYIVDTIESTPGALMSLRDEKFFTPYFSPHLKAYPDGAKEKAPGGLVYWTTDRESYIGVAYNKNAIKTAELPKKFDDLLKPALKGKMAISSDESSARQIGAMVYSKGDGFVRKLKEQEISLQGASGPGFNELIVSGEVPLSFVGFSTNVAHSAKKGAPVGWHALDLAVANAGGVGISVNAQHPHAALLLLDFLISPDGQKMFGETFAYGSGAKNYGFEKYYPEKGLTTVEYSDRLERWMGLMREITRK